MFKKSTQNDFQNLFLFQNEADCPNRGNIKIFELFSVKNFKIIWKNFQKRMVHENFNALLSYLIKIIEFSARFYKKDFHFTITGCTINMGIYIK